MSNNYFSIGFGIGTKNKKGEWLEVFYPSPVAYPTDALVNACITALGKGKAAFEPDNMQCLALASELDKAGYGEHANLWRQLAQSTQPKVVCLLETDSQPANVPEAYLKLQLLSHRLIRPHGQNLAGIFGVLPNVAWTSEGAIDINELAARQLQARIEGRVLDVLAVDKFPKMLNYVAPSGVRVADGSRIRLGAYLGEGTTVMHEGFVNFNAGTEGPNMIEGRISAGVFVSKGSDLGGGSSTMGTLSGGGNIVISVGEESLIGANAGIGIPLGDRCKVESGLYITAGSVITVIDNEGKANGKVKARELAGKSDLLFRRNSTTGALEVLTNKSAVELNAALHRN
jgi:2,3,4,5-tetrahydropyridine-2-carboxylate N-succinyltransferase